MKLASLISKRWWKLIYIWTRFHIFGDILIFVFRQCGKHKQIIWIFSSLSCFVWVSLTKLSLAQAKVQARTKKWISKEQFSLNEASQLNLKKMRESLFCKIINFASSDANVAVTSSKVLLPFGGMEIVCFSLETISSLVQYFWVNN